MLMSFRRGSTDNKLRESWIIARGDTLLTPDQLEQTASDFVGPFEQLIAINTDDK